MLKSSYSCLLQLYPTNDIDAYRVDEIMDAYEDVSTLLTPTMRMPEGPEKLAKRKVTLFSLNLTINIGNVQAQFLMYSATVNTLPL